MQLRFLAVPRVPHVASREEWRIPGHSLGSRCLSEVPLFRCHPGAAPGREPCSRRPERGAKRPGHQRPAAELEGQGGGSGEWEGGGSEEEKLEEEEELAGGGGRGAGARGERRSQKRWAGAQALPLLPLSRWPPPALEATATQRAHDRCQGGRCCHLRPSRP